MNVKDRMEDWRTPIFRRLVTLLLSFPFVGSASNAATIELIPAKIPDEPAFIFVTGGITAEDSRRFIEHSSATRKAIVAFNSPGGDLRAGLTIGATIRLRGFATLVDRDAYCASACALAWLGGFHRYMRNGAKIGFHAAYVNSNGFKKETGMGNAVAGAYLNELGIPVEAIEYITKAAPDEIQWLSFRDALILGISVRSLKEKIE